MLSNLLATKLHRPSLLARRVRRPYLVARLKDGLEAERRLTLVSAPPGFGKTSCVVEWLAGSDFPVAWLSLEPADDDPPRFFAYLLAALQGVDSSIGREMAKEPGTGQSASMAALTTTVLNDILNLGRRILLVLDDFHVVREKAILEVIETLIAGGPNTLHLVLITREDPLLPLARLRANNQVTEIRAADLRFSEDEASRLLTGLMELPLSETDVAVLEERTEGWVAGLQLAGLSMRGRSDPSGFIACLSGSHRHILSYLTEEVLDRQPAAIRDFLLQTSILDRLHGDLCRAVITGEGDGEPETQDCRALLERLCAANLFLIPLDEDGEWYRYHHLFGQLLQARLKQTAPADEIQALHGRASDWLAGHDQTDEAIRHALAGRDFERAVVLVDGAARGMIFAGRMHTLRGWLSSFPAACRAAYPRLEVYRAWIELLEGKLDAGEKAAQEREEMLNALPASPENDRLRVELTAVLCRYSPVFGNPARSIRLAEKALAALDADRQGHDGPNEADDVTRARLLFGLAVAHSLEAKATDATREFEESLRLAKSTHDGGLAADVLGLMAQNRTHCGRLGEAVRLYQAIIDLAGEEADSQRNLAGAWQPSEGRGSAREAPLAGLGYLGLAGIYLERYDLERAEASLERGIELCSGAGLDGIYTGYSIRSRLAQVRGDLTGALADIESLERRYRRGDDPLLAARRIMLARATGDTAAIQQAAEPWIELLKAGPAGADTQPPALVLDVVKVLVARACLALGDTGRVLELLGEVETRAQQDGRLGLLLDVYLLEALARQASRAEERRHQPGGTDRRTDVHGSAREAIERALLLAEPEGYALVFIEEAPEVVPLLRAAADHTEADRGVRQYAEKILALLSLPDVEQREGAGDGHASTRRSGGKESVLAAEEPAPVEPLSARELEILRLMGEGSTNQDIAGRLVITLHTVKKHSSNIFGKLGVTSRTQAVARARRLGLLE